MNKIHLYDKILSPVVTEKSTNLSEQNKIVFKVHEGASKKSIKKNLIHDISIGIDKHLGAINWRQP